MMNVYPFVVLCVLVLSDFGASRSLGPLHRGIRSASSTPTPRQPDPVSSTVGSVAGEAVDQPTTRAPAIEQSSTSPNPSPSPDVSTTAAVGGVSSSSPDVVTGASPSSPAGEVTETPAQPTTAQSLGAVSVAGKVTETPAQPTTAQSLEGVSVAGKVTETPAQPTTAQSVGAVSAAVTEKVTEPEKSSEVVKNDTPIQTTEVTPSSGASNPVITTETSAAAVVTQSTATDNASEARENRLDQPASGGASVPPIATVKEDAPPGAVAGSPAAPTPNMDANVQSTIVTVPVQQISTISLDPSPSPQTKLALTDEDPSFGASNPEIIFVPAQVIHIEGTTSSSVLEFAAGAVEKAENVAELGGDPSSGAPALEETSSVPAESNPSTIPSAETPVSTAAPESVSEVTSGAPEEIKAVEAQSTTQEPAAAAREVPVEVSSAPAVPRADGVLSTESPKSDAKEEVVEKKETTPTETPSEVPAVVSEVPAS